MGQFSSAKTTGTANPDQSAGWRLGEATNGIYGEVQVVWRGDQNQIPEVYVFVNEGTHNSNALLAPTWSWWDQGPQRGTSSDDNFRGFGEAPNPKTDWITKWYTRDNASWPYHMATNSFCGPIELVNAERVKLPSLKPAMNSPGAYPAFISFRAIGANIPADDPPHTKRSDFPKPLIGAHPCLARIKVGDLFNIKEPGEYYFTVWPKIYMCSVTNSDTRVRVDVPPVTVSFKYRPPSP